MKYLKEARYRIFPEITDWTEEYNDLRAKHPNDMRYIEWFWFHPSAFKLMKYGIPIIGFTHFLGAGLILQFKFDLRILTVLCYLICLWCIYQFYKAYTELKLAPDMNFYDLYLRDYEVLQ